MTDPAVLVTGCGAPGFPGTLWSLRQSPSGEALRVVGTDVRREQAGRHLADEFYRVPPAEDEAFVDELVDVCREESVDVILPQVTRELPVLASNKTAFEEVGTTVAVSDANAIADANDKKALIDVCRECDVPAPETSTAETEDDLREACRQLGYPDVPVVVKPPASNGSRGVRILDERRDHKRQFYEAKPTGLYSTLDDVVGILGEEFPRLLVMEYLPGEEYTVDAFRAADARTQSDNDRAVVVPRVRDEVRSGISFRGTIERREDIVAHVETLARELDLRYAFGFQFKEDADGRPKILECNPRVQGSMVTSTLGGANVTYAAVAEALGESGPSLEPEWGTSLYRYWGGIGVSDGVVVGNIGDVT